MKAKKKYFPTSNNYNALYGRTESLGHCDNVSVYSL